MFSRALDGIGYMLSRALDGIGYRFSRASVGIGYIFSRALDGIGYMFSRASVGIGFMFSRALHWHKLSRAWHQLRFPAFSTSHTFCLTLALLARVLFMHNTGNMFSRPLVGIGFVFSRAMYWYKFSRAWHRLHVFPCLVTWIFALSSHFFI